MSKLFIFLCKIKINVKIKNLMVISVWKLYTLIHIRRKTFNKKTFGVSKRWPFSPKVYKPCPRGYEQYIGCLREKCEVQNIIHSTICFRYYNLSKVRKNQTRKHTSYFGYSGQFLGTLVNFYTVSCEKDCIMQSFLLKFSHIDYILVKITYPSFSDFWVSQLIVTKQYQIV